MKKPVKSRITTAEAAEILGLSVPRVNILVKEGRFLGSSYCECGHSNLIPVIEIHRYMRERGVNGIRT
jgi:hypothetical protein